MKQELKIEKGVPIPKTRNRMNTDTFSVMKVGDSVLLPISDGLKESTIRRYAHLYLGPGKYTCRKMDGGVRVWRTK